MMRVPSRFPQNFLDDVIVLLWPITAAAQLPDVDQIADDVESFGFIVAQKIKQGGGVASARAQMHIRNPRRAHTPHRL